MTTLPANALGVAINAARSAGVVLLDHLNRDIQISKKGRINLVTEVDLKSEKILVDLIQERFPDHEFLAEEGGIRPTSSDYRWIIDPLDGTTNYAHGYRFFCVSIALEHRGKIVVGVIHDPVTEETFTATRGGGAFLNGDRIKVSSEEQLSEAMVCTGFSYQEEAVLANLALFNRIIQEARAVRRDGSAALDLCYVACGRFDGFWELQLSPWDVAAGMLIVSEAGGRVSLFDGNACTPYDQEILATNGKIHSALSRELLAAS